jgi:hypothetical protein
MLQGGYIMRYPYLITKQSCSTAVHVTFYDEGLAETGAPIVLLDADLFCNYQDSAKVVLTKEKKEVQLTGVALFRGDIAPNAKAISSGEVIIFDEARSIVKGTKARNPDGTVNYCRLELM